jgi:hypothetical protein
LNLWKWKPRQQCFRKQVQLAEAGPYETRLWHGLSFSTIDILTGRLWGW